MKLDAKSTIEAGKAILGIELGSTRINDRIPWDEFEVKYAKLFPSDTGNVAKPLRMALFVTNLFRIQRRILCALLHLFRFWHDRNRCKSWKLQIAA